MCTVCARTHTHINVKMDMNYFKYCRVFSTHFCSVIMVSAAVRFYKLLGPCMFICLGQTEYLNLSLLPFFKHCTVLQSLIMNLFIYASVCVDMWKCFLISLACYTITSVAFLSLPIYIIVSNSHNNVSSYIQACDRPTEWQVILCCFSDQTGFV